MTTEQDEKVFFTVGDEECCDDELALSHLLKDGVLLCNTAHYSWNKDGKSNGETIVLFVNCNDIFAWACADAETVTTGEIPALYRLWQANNAWGPAKWCAIKRNEKPQAPAIEYMKKAGIWDEQMEALRPNHYDTALNAGKSWIEAMNASTSEPSK